MKRVLIPLLLAGTLAGDLAAQEASDRAWWVGLGLGSTFVDDVENVGGTVEIVHGRGPRAFLIRMAAAGQLGTDAGGGSTFSLGALYGLRTVRGPLHATLAAGLGVARCRGYRSIPECDGGNEIGVPVVARGGFRLLDGLGLGLEAWGLWAPSVPRTGLLLMVMVGDLPG